MLAAGGLADVVLAQELRRFKVAYASPRRAAPSGWRTKRDASRPTVSSPSSSSSAGRRPARWQPWDRERAAGRGHPGGASDRGTAPSASWRNTRRPTMPSCWRRTTRTTRPCFRRCPIWTTSPRRIPMPGGSGRTASTAAP